MHDDNGEDSEKQGEPDQEAGDDDTVDLYEYFSVAASASADEIKKSFRKMCLKFHPDKLTSLTSDADKAASTRKFQELSRYYAILSDPVRRKRYDETGYMGDSDRFVDVENFRPDGGWDSYFRNLWGKLTEDSIDKFTINYRGSSEELQDVLAAYKKNKGSMDAVLDSVPVSSWEDEARFREMILPIVEAGDAPRYVAFFKADPAATRRRQQRAEREAKEAEKQRNAPAKKKAGGKTKGKSEDDGLEALKAAISKRDPMADLIARLEKQEAAKASHSKRTAAKNKGKVEGRGVDAQADDEESTAAAGLPTDEEFAAIQAKMIAGSKGRSKGKDASITRKTAGSLRASEEREEAKGLYS
ncbi:hypothetical protein DFJ73DRAFT_633702 [Zopfochytrium polystomum]|nr:hypothetical protein DFJ73DRAFT_633702 [Zopfochytrium polystomum]